MAARGRGGCPQYGKVPVRPGVAPPALRLAAASYYQTGGCPELSLENILEQSTAESAMKAPLIDCIVSGN